MLPVKYRNFYEFFFTVNRQPSTSNFAPQWNIGFKIYGIYSGPPLMQPPLGNENSGCIRGVAAGQG